MTIVDAHHHLWDLAIRDQPWIGQDQPIRRTFTPDDLRDVARPCGVVASVLVQCIADVDETIDFLAVAAGDPLVAGVVGYVDLASADIDEQIARLRNHVGGDRLVGIRHVVEGEPDANWLARADVIRGLHAVARHGLAYDLLVRAANFDAALAAIRSVSEGRFVLDHLGKPAIAHDGFDAWAAAIEPLAAAPNVVAKLSGLCTEADWANWTAVDLRPYVEHALQIFGTDRLLFGSDWPVCLLATGYQEQIDTMSALLGHLDAAERHAIFHANAVRTYQLTMKEEDGA